MTSRLPTRSPASRRSASSSSLSSSSSLLPSLAAARTSPRLDSTGAFFSGVPSHSISVLASYSASSGSHNTADNNESPPHQKKFIITASNKGEMVHWSYIPGIGYQARAMLLPPTPNLVPLLPSFSSSLSSSSSSSSGGGGHHRSYWMPSVPGSSLVSSGLCSSPQLAQITALTSCRVANKEVFVVADSGGTLAQWSIDGDCCYCATKMTNYPITHMKTFHTDTTSIMQTQANSSSSPSTSFTSSFSCSSSSSSSSSSSVSTYALCASTFSPLILLVDLLQMHVLRRLDITPDELELVWHSLHEESEETEEEERRQQEQIMQQQREEEENEEEGVEGILHSSRSSGVACMDLRHALEQDSNMIPPVLSSEQLIVLSTRGRLSVWDLGAIVHSTLQLSADAGGMGAGGEPMSPSFGGSSGNSSATAAEKRRARAASMSSAFFASLPPLDCSQSACLHAGTEPLHFLSSPLVSCSVYSAPIPDVCAALCSSDAFILVVMQNQWVVIDADTCMHACNAQRIEETLEKITDQKMAEETRKKREEIEERTRPTLLPSPAPSFSSSSASPSPSLDSFGGLPLPPPPSPPGGSRRTSLTRSSASSTTPPPLPPAMPLSSSSSSYSSSSSSAAPSLSSLQPALALKQLGSFSAPIQDCASFLARSVASHRHSASCSFAGGSWLYAPPSASSAAASASCTSTSTSAAQQQQQKKPPVLLWTNCGFMAVYAMVDAQQGKGGEEGEDQSNLASPPPILNTTMHATHHRQTQEEVRCVAILQLPPSFLAPTAASASSATPSAAPSAPSPFCVHIPTSSHDLDSLPASCTLPILVGNHSGCLLEFEVPLEWETDCSVATQLLQPLCISNFTDAFATQTYLHRFQNQGKQTHATTTTTAPLSPARKPPPPPTSAATTSAAAAAATHKSSSLTLPPFHPAPAPSSTSIPPPPPGTALISPSQLATCSTLLFDLVSHVEFGMSSLLILLVKGFSCGRLDFFQILTSSAQVNQIEPPRSSFDDQDTHESVRAAAAHSRESNADDAFHSLPSAHSDAITALLAFQSHESVFSLPLLVSASLDCTVAVWEARSSSLVFRLRVPSAAVALARPILPPSSAQLLAPSVASGEKHTRIAPQTSCSDLELVCVVCADYSVRIFSIVSMQWIQVLRGHDSIPRAIYRDEWAMMHDVIFVSTDSGAVYIWSMQTGILEEVIEASSQTEGMELIQRFPLYGAGNAARSIATAAAMPSVNFLSPSPNLSPSPLPTRPTRSSSTISSPQRSSSSISSSPLKSIDNPPAHSRSRSFLHAPSSLRVSIGSGSSTPLSPIPTSPHTPVERERESKNEQEENTPTARAASAQLPSPPPPSASSSTSSQQSQPITTVAVIPGSSVHVHALHTSAGNAAASHCVTPPPPRMQRSITAPSSLRIIQPWPASPSSSAAAAAAPVASTASSSSSAAASIVSAASSVKSGNWALHYGLQRLWKLGGKGGLWGGSAADSSSNNSKESSSGVSLNSAANSSSNLICSFESLPELQLSVFSIDIGYFTAEIKHSYAPLDASSDTSIAGNNNTISTTSSNGNTGNNNNPLVNLDTKHRAEVYKEILKLIMDWNDENDTSSSSTTPRSSSSSSSSSSSVVADSAVLDLLRSKFHMRSPHSSRRSASSSLSSSSSASRLGGSLSSCFACYSPTNNALTILLPRTCSNQAQSRMLAAGHVHRNEQQQLAHLSRWSIGPNFSANHSLCLTTVLLALLGSSDIQLHNYYSLLEAFYNATLPTIHAQTSIDDSPLSSSQLLPPLFDLWHYTEADIPFLSSYALHEHEDIRRSSRLLIQGIIGRMQLYDLWGCARDWSAFYDNMGTSAPPPLPWTEHVLSANSSGSASSSSNSNLSVNTTTLHSFPVPPRYVSDFEFMTSMLLCYLYAAQARKSRGEATTIANSKNNNNNSTPLYPSSSSSQLTHARSDGKVRPTPMSSLLTLPPAPSPSLPPPHPPSTAHHDDVSPIIQLDLSMFGLSSGLKIESSPPPASVSSASKPPVSLRSNANKLPPSLRLTDESKSDAESSISPSSTVQSQAPAPIQMPPLDKTPWIISTLLRLLAQTHQDSSLHSIQKSSICVELLIQGLSQATRSSSSSSSSSGSTSSVHDDFDTNLFWKYIPVSALEPLYRIIFDLSLVSTSEPLQSLSSANPASGDRRRGSDANKTMHSTTPQLAFSSNCRQLLFELAKFDLAHFIEWVRKEIFGANAASGAGGNDINQPDTPSLKRSTSTQPPSPASATASSSAAALSAAAAAAASSTPDFSSFKSLHFDEYRYQLISILCAMPRKFVNRMNYGVLKCMLDVWIRVMDPTVVVSQYGHSTSANHHHHKHATTHTQQLRDRIHALLIPLYHYLSAKYTWISFCASSNKLSIVDNWRWIYYERCALGFYQIKNATSTDSSSLFHSSSSSPSPHPMLDAVSEQQQQYLLTQPPLIQIYDLNTANKWRTLEGHAPGSEIECIAFSQNGHYLSSYCSTDSPHPSVRVWSTAYESSSVGSGFLPTRLLMKTIFKLNPFCVHLIELPSLEEKSNVQKERQQRKEKILQRHGCISNCQIAWKEADAFVITREDETNITLKL